MYSWSEMPSFSEGRKQIDDDVSEWDCFQWAIEETLCANPLANSHALGTDTDFLYFRTWQHPGTSHLPRLVIVYRIDSEPADGNLGLLEAHFIFPFSDLDADAAPKVVPFLVD